MAHDPLCHAGDCTRCHGNFAYCVNHICDCTPIKAARADEQARHHTNRCCAVCDTHVDPHRGCILR